jgi:DNA-binding transcriptional MerR regulator
MSDVQERAEGAPVQETQAKADSQGMTPEDIRKMIAEAVTETNSKWQSRFDRLREEKVQTERQAMTVEERIAQMEAERVQERVSWARKEAKARAAIDDEFEAAALAYASDDPEAIGQAAASLKRLLDGKEAVLKAQVAELEKRLQYGSKAPSGTSGSLSLDFSKMSIDEVTKFAQQSPEHLSEVMAWKRSQKRS